MYAIPAHCTETYCKTSWWTGCLLELSYTQVVWVQQMGVVSAVLLSLGKLNVKHLILLRKMNLYRRLLKSCDTFLCDVFLTFLSGNVCNDDVLMPVFLF